MSKIKKLGGVEYIKISDIIIGERLRQVTPAVKLKVESIAKSIKSLGPLQPVILDEKKNLMTGLILSWTILRGFYDLRISFKYNYLGGPCRENIQHR